MTDAWRSAPIEPAIAPLCAALNAVPSVHTYATCQGHWSWKGGRSPYVAFFADTAFASALDRLIFEALRDGSPRLRAFWMVEGRFNERHELTFNLFAPALRSDTGSLSLDFTRRRIDPDLAVLRDFVQRAAQLWNGRQ